MASDDRTEKPTGRRLQDARKKGQVARSRNVTQAATLVTALLVLSWTGRGMIAGLGEAMRRGLETAGAVGHLEIEPGLLLQTIVANATTLGLLVGPVAMAVAFTVVASQVAQHGWVVSIEALQFDFSRLNPVHGLSRLGFKRAGLDTLLTLVIAGTVGYLCYQVISGTLNRADELARLRPLDAWGVAWQNAQTMLRRTAIALGTLAVLDFALQQWRYIDNLKMTKQEVKDDTKLMEGNPEVKARIRRIQREMARRRMLADAAKATVVITNPTHFAVALKYERALMSAPTVVAKGQDKLAQKIKDIAREHGVPMVENKPLAQALYKGTEVGDSVPAALFEAVAEVLAYLIRLKQLVL